MKPILTARNLTKRYRLGTLGAGSLREDLERWWAVRRGRAPAASERDFLALDDVSFDVMPGEVVGVIGRNGAGKSTLLKVLSRITEPTAGEVRLRGRVASLLEVGTGFHPELSGRDNIFLNGAILGMTRAEILSKFDEIVAFAEIGRFVDTPVKRYSSGMYVRLAFAVAAHLEPEILIVDEVLAVGDVSFQKKCLGKMEQVSREGGRTVLFVSHNMGAVSSLTQKCLYLSRGRALAYGDTRSVVQTYLGDTFARSGSWKAPAVTQHALQVESIRLLAPDGREDNEFEVAEGFEVEIRHVVRKPVKDALIELWFFASDGQKIFTVGDFDTHPELRGERAMGSFTSRVRIPGDLLNHGTYYLIVNSGVGGRETYDYHEVASFEMVEHTQRSPRSGRGGYFSPVVPWRISEGANNP
jgi:lipopolysaccharide transport system ATP-binding protein